MKKQTLEDKVSKLLENKDHENVSVELSVDESQGSIEINTDSTFIKIEYQLSEYPYTCGMMEIGDLVYEGDDEIENIVTKDRIARLLVKALEQTISACTAGVAKLGLSCTIPFEDDKYDIFQLALIKLNFINVGEFKNKNSGNNLKHYILI